MTPLPSPSLKSAEEVAKAIIEKWNGVDSVSRPLIYLLTDTVSRDRSRLVQYIREKMPKERVYSEDRDASVYDSGFNDAIEAVEKLLEGMK